MKYPADPYTEGTCFTSMLDETLCGAPMAPRIEAYLHRNIKTFRNVSTYYNLTALSDYVYDVFRSLDAALNAWRKGSNEKIVPSCSCKDSMLVVLFMKRFFVARDNLEAQMASIHRDPDQDFTKFCTHWEELLLQMEKNLHLPVEAYMAEIWQYVGMEHHRHVRESGEGSQVRTGAKIIKEVDSFLLKH